jgi:hypothetical protein
MTDCSYDPFDPGFTDRASLPRKIFTRTAPVLAAFTFSALVALRLAGGLAGEAYAPAQELTSAPAPAPGDDPVAPTAALKAEAVNLGQNPYGALFDPEGSLVGVPALFAQSQPIGPNFSPLQSEPLFVLVDPAPQVVAEAVPAPQVAETAPESGPQIAESVPPVAEAAPQANEQVAEAEPEAPIPPARPAEFSVQPRAAESSAPRAVENATPRPVAPRATARERAQASTLAHNDPRNFFEKLFSGSQEKGPQLAYASPEGGVLNLSRGATSSPSPVTASGGTAVYDIAAHTVTLPSGERLEAHSGLGPYFDDPDHVNLRMRGATPPAVYELKLRESLFHGVQALRLTPVSGSTYGRNGLLAHTFMLGQRGDSNGCVSFRNYRAFLQAYMNGEVRRLVVVARRS